MQHEPVLHFLGHAGLLLEFSGVSVLCDPWMSKTGAFLRSWHQFPPNDWIDLDPLYQADYLYISHIHQDHFDKRFLASFPKEKVTVILADAVSGTLARQLRTLGFPRIMNLQDWEPLRLADAFSVSIVRDPALYKGDSLLCMTAGDTRIINKNDCHIPSDLLPRFREYGVHLLLAQFSPATWYPQVYGYERDEALHRADLVKRQLSDGFVRVANGVQANQVVPFAGPPCFLDEANLPLNFAENGIFADQNDVYQALSDRTEGTVTSLLPGDRLTFEAPGRVRVEQRRGFDFSRKSDLLQSYARSRRPIIEGYLHGLPEPGDGFLNQFAEHILRLFRSSPLLCERVNALVKFTLSGPCGGVVWLDVHGKEPAVYGQQSEEPNYEFCIPAAVARLLVDGRETWEDLFLSMRLGIRCNPDVYNWPLFALLRYGAEPELIVEVERTLARGVSDTLRVRDGDTWYRIQRYCPHSGEDLSYAQIADGRLTCPRHGWTFDLRGGGACLMGGNLSLAVEREGPGAQSHPTTLLPVP